MPFGLKNGGATYQLTDNKIFSGQLDRNIEAYVEDTIVKSKAQSDDLTNMRETLGTLRKFRMMLNPKKCLRSQRRKMSRILS